MKQPRRDEARAKSDGRSGSETELRRADDDRRGDDPDPAANQGSDDALGGERLPEAPHGGGNTADALG